MNFNHSSFVLVGVFFFSSFIGSVASAQEFYLGLGYGQYKFEFDNDEIDTDFDDSKEVLKIFGGGKINEAVGLELTYLGFGESSDKGLDADIEGLSFAGIISLPASEYFSVFGKIGWLAWEADISGDFGLISVKETLDGNDLFFGAGLKFGLGEMVDLRIEYDRYEIDDDFNPELDIASISAQVVF